MAMIKTEEFFAMILLRVVFFFLGVYDWFKSLFSRS